MPAEAVLQVHLAATIFMTGLIWFVQLVHYPMFADVGAGAFVSYARIHQGRTSTVVVVPMLIELATAGWLWFLLEGPARVALSWSLVSLAVIWLSTATLQIPCHSRLVQKREPEVIRRLVSTNWIRTLAWSARSVLVLWAL